MTKAIDTEDTRPGCHTQSGADISPLVSATPSDPTPADAKVETAPTTDSTKPEISSDDVLVPTGGFASLQAKIDHYGLNLPDFTPDHIAIDSDPITTPSDFLHAYLPKYELVKKLQQGELHNCLLLGPCYYSVSNRTLIVFDPCYNGGCAAYATWIMKCMAE